MIRVMLSVILYRIVKDYLFFFFVWHSALQFSGCLLAARQCACETTEKLSIRTHIGIADLI